MRIKNLLLLGVRKALLLIPAYQGRVPLILKPGALGMRVLIR